MNYCRKVKRKIMKNVSFTYFSSSTITMIRTKIGLASNS